MIGCGHVENGEWQFKSLVAEHLSAGEEIRIINEWVDHMGSVRDRLDPQNGMPRVFHWSAAEPTVLDKAYNSAKARHPEHEGPLFPQWTFQCSRSRVWAAEWSAGVNH